MLDVVYGGPPVRHLTLRRRLSHRWRHWRHHTPAVEIAMSLVVVAVTVVAVIGVGVYLGFV